MRLRFLTCAAAFLVLSAISARVAQAQGTTFTYQGRLLTNGAPASGFFDFQFAVFDALSGGAQQGTTFNTNSVTVTNGLFTVTLDPGANVFTGGARWLLIRARPSGSPAFTSLLPLQPITASPYAVLAGRASTLSGSISVAQLPSSVVTNGATNLNLNGNFSGFGAGLDNVNAATLGGIGSAGFWRTNGNWNANPVNGAFLGTVDTLPFEIRVDSRRAFRLEPYDDSPNLIGGSYRNSAGANLRGVTIAGGGSFDFPNRATNDYASVLGGFGNTAGGRYAVAMGFNTTAQGVYSLAAGAEAHAAGFSAIALGNLTTAVGSYSLAAGRDSVASGESAIALGWGNTASQLGATALGVATQASGERSTAAGFVTVASGFCSTALGRSTTAAGDYSMAAGHNARANHPGSFVWADSSAGDFTSGTSDGFLVRASGGVGFGTGSPQAPLHLYSANNPTTMRIQSTGTPGFGRIEFVSNPQGDVNEWRPSYIESSDSGGFTGGLRFVVNGTGAGNKFAEMETMRLQNGRVGIGTTAPGQLLQVGNATCNGTTWNNASDRNLKENFKRVDAQAVLEKVASLPLSEWNYKSTPGEFHLGPMAQDFKAAFGTGADDKHIATVDADGVALAAIQGLNQKLEQKEKEIAALQSRLERLERILSNHH